MIIKASESDKKILAKLAACLWSGHTLSELEDDFEKLLQKDSAVCFIKYADDSPVGFAQCQLRTDYVEGTHSSPVGYLEGIFVLGKYRHNGYAREMLNCCEHWAKEKGCTEFAGDCELSNHESFRFLLASGFSEANRIICFKKDLE